MISIIFGIVNLLRCTGLVVIGTILFLLILPNSLLFGGKAGVKELSDNYVYLLQTARKLYNQKPRR